MLLPALPKHVLENAPWSVSKAGVIEKCSLQFAHKYGPNKIKELTADSSEALYGKAVHQALELALGGGFSLKAAFQQARNAFSLTDSENEQLQSFYENCHRFVKQTLAYRKHYGITADRLFLERKWAIDPQFKPCKFFDDAGLFRGAIDLGMLTNKKNLVVIDHKSGKMKDKSFYETQFKAYAVLGLASFPDLVGVQPGINFIEPGRLQWLDYVPAAQIRDEYHPWLINYLIDSCKGLTSPPTTTKGWWCGWCGYKPICPLYHPTSANNTVPNHGSVLVPPDQT